MIMSNETLIVKLVGYYHESCSVLFTLLFAEKVVEIRIGLRQLYGFGRTQREPVTRCYKGTRLLLDTF